ncbi:hypothetical protein QZN30_05845 [Burkholderia multivorans]|nr:hypothetical protein [Burkholderia multivorans]
MTKTEKALRDALTECMALLQQDPKQPKSYKVDVAIGNAKRALAMEVTPTPVFYSSGNFVRGPSRPEGSGYKEMVFRLSSEHLAQRTAENLSSLFAAHCITDSGAPAIAKARSAAVAAREAKRVIFAGVPLVSILETSEGWQVQQRGSEDGDDWSNVQFGLFRTRAQAEDAAPALCGF